MLTIIRLLTFGFCFVFLSFVLIFDTIIGNVLVGLSVGYVLLASIVLAILFSSVLAFGNVFPWCRKKGHAGNNIVKSACGVTATLILGVSLYLYLAITILDDEPRKIHLVRIGMTKPQIVALVGVPDWEEPNNLWAYRLRGDGLTGILAPYYFTFDAKGMLTSIHS